MKNIQDEIKHYDRRVGKSNQSYCPASRTKRQNTEQKATGGIDIEPQSKISEILERKKKWNTENFPRKGTGKFSTHKGHRASRLKGPSQC